MLGCLLGGFMHGGDFECEGLVIQAAVAVWFVFHDGFSVAGRFGEFDVASDTGVEDSDVGPGANLIALGGEETFEIGRASCRERV